MCYTGSCPYEYPMANGDCGCRLPNAVQCPLGFDDNWESKDEYPDYDYWDDCLNWLEDDE